MSDGKVAIKFWEANVGAHTIRQIQLYNYRWVKINTYYGGFLRGGGTPNHPSH